MPTFPSGRPASTEHDAYYLKYLNLVPEDDIVGVLEGQEAALRAELAAFAGEQALRRYAPGKWSVKEVLGHLVDTERVIGVKLVYAVRRDPTRLAWHDQDWWVERGGFDALEMDDLYSELRALRGANLHLLRRLTPADWTQPRLEGAEYTPRALAYLLAGHIRYHLNIVRERYLPLV